MWFVGYTGVHKATMTIRSHFYVQIVITKPKIQEGMGKPTSVICKERPYPGLAVSHPPLHRIWIRQFFCIIKVG